MSDVNSQPWGMCAAYGCPLAGSMGSGGQWWCFCHHEQPSGANSEITMTLRANGVLSRLSVALRGRDEKAIALCRQELRGHAHGAELAFNREKDRNAHGWLMRIESKLAEMTVNASERILKPKGVQTSSVIGPTHAMQHYTELG